MSCKILAIIPARGGSKSIPKKNIKHLLGKPLISYSIEAAQKSDYINRIVVSTDDEEISAISLEYGAEVPYLRPKDLSDDKSPTIDAIMHMLKWLNEKDGYFPDYVCLLQCTSPLRTYKDINGTIEKILDSEFDGAVSVCEAEVNPYWTNVFKGEKLIYFIEEGKYITRRQDLPTVYRMNGAIYVIKASVLLELKTFETDNITGYIMCNESSVDIDTKFDFKIAELLMKERNSHS